jgi:hypothetical protein
MKSSRVLLAFIAAAMAGTMVLAIRAADEPNKAPEKTGAQIKEELSLQEQILRDQFQQFQTSILKLKQRLERSGAREDLERAKTLDRILEQARTDGIAVQFDKLVESINKTNFNNIGAVRLVVDDTKRLQQNLAKIIAMFNLSNSASKLTEDRKRIEDIIKMIDRTIGQQQMAQIQNEIGKTGRNELAGLQKKVVDNVGKIGDALKQFGQGGEAKNDKGNSKEGKGGKSGESKDAGKGSESEGNSKEGQGGDKNKPSEAKGSEAKGGQGKDGQPSEAKGGKGSESKEGGAKGSKGGEGSQGEKKGNEGGEKKEGGAKDDGQKGGVKEKTAEAKGSEKSGEKSSSESKSGKGSESKEGGAKGSKGGEGQPSESKSGGKGSDSESKQGESKSGSQSQGQSSSKSGGDPQSAQKQDPKQQQQNSNQPQEVTQGKKKIQDADYSANQAEKKITKNDPKEAIPDQQDTAKNLEDAKRKLEKLLQQLREEELERLLAALEARCQKMLAMQIEVYEGTVSVHKGVEKTADKTPTREHKIESNRLSDKEKDIVLEASKAIEMLEAEGSAVAFPEVFQQVREDMKHVQRRLDITDVAGVTQAIEKDIIDTLKEMIDALKKAQQEIQNKKNPPPGQPPPPNPNADQKLLDQIAELKMIRSLQVKLNSRTTTYGRMYPGEQAREPNIRREVIQLGDRQERIFDITNRIAKGDNK